MPTADRFGNRVQAVILCGMQASYAMGYNLAVEYLADFEKTWMLDSFKELDARVLQPQQRALKEWLFLEVNDQEELQKLPPKACVCLISYAQTQPTPYIAIAAHSQHQLNS